MKRRVFIKGTLAGGAITAALGAGLLTPNIALAAWPKGVMESKDMPNTGDASGSVKIKAPDIAENGAVVPIEVDAREIDGIVESISIVVQENQRPLAATYHLKEGAVAFVATRLKMGKTSDVYGVVTTASGTFNAKKTVKVTIGGCGG